MEPAEEERQQQESLCLASVCPSACLSLCMFTVCRLSVHLLARLPVGLSVYIPVCMPSTGLLDVLWINSSNLNYNQLSRVWKLYRKHTFQVSHNTQQSSSRATYSSFGLFYFVCSLGIYAVPSILLQLCQVYDFLQLYDTRGYVPYSRIFPRGTAVVSEETHLLYFIQDNNSVMR